MCGIVGLIDTIAGRVSPCLLETMRDVMIRRGPDGEGHYLDGAVGMAMRRLSIIDIEGGWQPFFSRNNEVVAFQNGEIYNHRDLRQQLEKLGHRFSSHSDTEVLAHGFTQWGMEGLLHRLDGMYALSILDRGKRTLHLARDRFGEKPLFYTASKGRFAYSSNLLVLAALPWVGDELDAQSVDCYLALHYIPGDATIFKAIRRVLPGQQVSVSIDDPIPVCQRYYKLPLGNEKRLSDDHLMGLVEEAVESRLLADVPVGIFLSGGLDSSIIAAIAARKQPAISTFSMAFNSTSHNEGPHAETVARHVGSRHFSFLFDEQSFCSLLPKVAAALDEPVGDQALLPLYWLCQEARRYVTVALSGEGADEVFAGYNYYRNHSAELGWRERMKRQFLGPSFRDHPLQSLLHNPEPVTPSGFPLLTDRAGRNRLTGRAAAEPNGWEEELFNQLNQSGNPLQRATATDLTTWLPDDLLVKFDRMSMAHSLEGRAPYLHPGTVEAGLRLSAAQRMDGSTSKVALRRIASRWLPAEILDRPKQGFVLPMAEWLQQWLRAHPSVKDYFFERAMPCLDMKELAQLVQTDLSAGIQQERLVFALVLLVEWYQAFTGKLYQLQRQYRAALESGETLPQAGGGASR